MRFLPLLLTLVSNFAHATTLLVVTDQAKAVKAQEVAALFRSTEPYSLMKDLVVKVISTSPAKLGCQLAATSSHDLFESDKSDDLLERSEWRDRSAVSFVSAGYPPSCNQKENPISRLISCDTSQARSYLRAVVSQEKAKYAIIVKTDARYGGSGGKYPVITTGSPASMAIHELMHQLGFADEYAYTNACEADMYCGDLSGNSVSPSGYGSLPGTSFNIAAFNARASYSSSADARRVHGSRIPWLLFIAGTTDLVHGGALGTAPAAGRVGLFRTVVCDKATSRLDTWQSMTDVSIMRTLNTTHIPKDYWPTIAKSLGTRVTP